MNVANFDESKVNWQRLPDLDHLWLSILDVDDTAKVVDVLFKFAANEKIVLHRHVAAFHTLSSSASSKRPSMPVEGSLCVRLRVRVVGN